MLWDFIQQGQIGRVAWAAQDANATAKDSLAEARLLKVHLQTLEQTVERTALAAMAIAEILRDRLGITEAELETKIQEIDLRDGRLDGKLRTQIQACQHCQRPNAAHRRACLYCGQQLACASPLFPLPPNMEN